MTPQLATRIVFFLSGLGLGGWAPVIPYVKHRLGVDDGGLGALLLCAGVGALVAMPVSGMLAGRFGCRRLIAVTGFFGFGGLPLLVAAPSAWTLALALAWFGAMLGALDAVMNMHAVLVERRCGRVMMSGFHGMWSVGGLAGSSVAGVMLTSGATPLLVMVVLAVVSFVSLLACVPSLLDETASRDGPSFAMPRGPVVLLGVGCFVFYLGEGTVTDWSAVFLHDARGVDEAHAGFGFVAFAGAMTVMRLVGDPIVRAAGARRVVFVGGTLAAAGLLLVVSVPSAWVSIAGYGLVGIGASNVVPVMFSAAGRQSTMPPNLAIAAMATFGYTGHLTGPAFVGFGADLTSLGVALGVVGVLMLLASVVTVRALSGGR